jgi:hypothetical protein
VNPLAAQMWQIFSTYGLHASNLRSVTSRLLPLVRTLSAKRKLVEPRQLALPPLAHEGHDLIPSQAEIDSWYVEG